MENNSPRNRIGQRETQQLGLSFPTSKRPFHIENNYDNYTPAYETMSDSLYLGPQGPWLEKMEEFNADYNTDFKFTKTFRWSPGYKKLLGAMILTALQLDERGFKRAPHLMLESSERNNYYIRRIKERFMNIHRGITDMRRQGLVWVEDPTLIFEKLDIIKETIGAQVEMMNQFTNMDNMYIHITSARRVYSHLENDGNGGYMFIPLEDWNDYIETHSGEMEEPVTGFYDMFEEHFLTIYMRMQNFNINVSDTAGVSMSKVNGHDIELEFHVSIPKLLNQLQGRELGNLSIGRNSGGSSYMGGQDLIMRRGRYWHPLNLPHPYVNHSTRNQYRWRNVCLGDLENSMRTQVVNLDFVSLMMAFKTWATSFTVGHTHPLNQIHNCHIGMPKSFSKRYQNSVGRDVTECSRSIINGLRTIELVDRADDPWDNAFMAMHNNVCDEVECVLRNNCSEYLDRKNRLETDKIEDTLTEEGLEILKQMTNWARTARGGRSG